MIEGLCSTCKEHLPIKFSPKIMRSPPSLISNHDDEKFNVLLR